MDGNLDAVKKMELYRSMQRIRFFEDRVSAMYKTGEIPGFVHCYHGEEAVAIGVCNNLRQADVITSTHRGHGHIIAKGCNCGELLAELCGKINGCSGGRGGSMHAYNMEIGLLGTNGMVGGGIGLAVGAAYAMKLKETDLVSVCFFGDGASNMGIFYESLNLASIWQLPVVFVCENNLYATATPLSMIAANPDIASRAASFNMPGLSIDGNDIEAVFRTAGDAINRARCGGGPSLIEARTYRTHGHHEGDQIYGTYRTKEELNAWKERCPIALYRHKLLTEGVAQEMFDKIDLDLTREMDQAVEYARQGAYPKPETISQYIYAEV